MADGFAGGLAESLQKGLALGEKRERTQLLKQSQAVEIYKELGKLASPDVSPEQRNLLAPKLVDHLKRLGEDIDTEGPAYQAFLNQPDIFKGMPEALKEAHPEMDDKRLAQVSRFLLSKNPGAREAGAMLIKASEQRATLKAVQEIGDLIGTLTPEQHQRLVTQPEILQGSRLLSEGTKRLLPTILKDRGLSASAGLLSGQDVATLATRKEEKPLSRITAEAEAKRPPISRVRAEAKAKRAPTDPLKEIRAQFLRIRLSGGSLGRLLESEAERWGELLEIHGEKEVNAFREAIGFKPITKGVGKGGIPVAVGLQEEEKEVKDEIGFLKKIAGAFGFRKEESALAGEVSPTVPQGAPATQPAGPIAGIEGEISSISRSEFNKKAAERLRQNPDRNPQEIAQGLWEELGRPSFTD